VDRSSSRHPLGRDHLTALAPHESSELANHLEDISRAGHDSWLRSPERLPESVARAIFEGVDNGEEATTELDVGVDRGSA
jgi:hypothetical protein